MRQIKSKFNSKSNIFLCPDTISSYWCEFHVFILISNWGGRSGLIITIWLVVYYRKDKNISMMYVYVP